MVALMDQLLVSLREMGPEALMVQAGEELPAHLRQTAYATAAEIMRSDGVLEEEEGRILLRLSQLLGLETQRTQAIIDSDGCASHQSGRPGHLSWRRVPSNVGSLEMVAQPGSPEGQPQNRQRLRTVPCQVHQWISGSLNQKCECAHQFLHCCSRKLYRTEICRIPSHVFRNVAIGFGSVPELGSERPARVQRLP